MTSTTIRTLKPVSNKTALHFKWGDQCDGWWLKNTGKFTVISESMPPHTSEKKHYHKHTEQFFYCLSGELSINLNHQVHMLPEHHGLTIPAGMVHTVKNTSENPVQFLVISAPNSHEDRIDLE